MSGNTCVYYAPDFSCKRVKKRAFLDQEEAMEQERERVEVAQQKEESGRFTGVDIKMQPRNAFAHIAQDDPLWKDLRQKFTLTASEFGMALGVSKNGSRNMCWARKVLPETVPISDFQRRMMENGHLGEEKCFEVLSKRMVEYLNAEHNMQKPMGPIEFAVPQKWETPYSLQKTGLWIIRDHYWKDFGKVETQGCSTNHYGASPDGLVMKGDERVATLEIKTPSKECIYQGLLLEKIEMELEHYVQVQAQMLAVGDVEWAYYACYTPSKIVVLKVRLNFEFLDWMLRELESFCNDYINTGKKPPRFAKGAGEARKDTVRKFMSQTPIKEFMTLENF